MSIYTNTQTSMGMCRQTTYFDLNKYNFEEKSISDAPYWIYTPSPPPPTTISKP